VCIGHIHIPYHRSLTGGDGRQVHYISSGSAGKPKDGDPRAGWVEVALGSQAEVAQHAAGDPAIGRAGHSDVWVAALVHRAEYDVESVAAEVIAAGLPESLADALRRA